MILMSGLVQDFNFAAVAYQAPRESHHARR